MEQIQFSFEAKVVRKTNEGFTAILNEDGYIIKFRDTKHYYSFNIGDILKITIGNVIEISNDEVKENYAIIYVVLHSFLSNGFLFRDIYSKRFFFWEGRGLITHKTFEKSNIFSEDDILKIVIKKQE